MTTGDIPIIVNIGFFHFGSPDKSARIASLKNALTEAKESSHEKSLADCLIVLPEAFNICGDYRDDPRPRSLDPSIPRSLAKLSEEFGVAFVTGLIGNGRRLQRYSYAYLIDDRICEQLSCKRQSDGTDNYEPCTADQDKPFVHRGVCVSALICLDAGTSENSERGLRLLERIRVCQSKHAVLCVPADTLSVDTESTAARWASHVHTVIANANDSRASIVHMKNAVKPIIFKSKENRVEITAFAIDNFAKRS